jgi:hypothetical protein
MRAVEPGASSRLRYFAVCAMSRMSCTWLLGSWWKSLEKSTPAAFRRCFASWGSSFFFLAWRLLAGLAACTASSRIRRICGVGYGPPPFTSSNTHSYREWFGRGCLEQRTIAFSTRLRYATSPLERVACACRARVEGFFVLVTRRGFFVPVPFLVSGSRRRILRNGVPGSFSRYSRRRASASSLDVSAVRSSQPWGLPSHGADPFDSSFPG